MKERVPPARTTPVQSPDNSVRPLADESFGDWMSRLRELVQRERSPQIGGTSLQGGF